MANRLFFSTVHEKQTVFPALQLEADLKELLRILSEAILKLGS